MVKKDTYTEAEIKESVSVDSADLTNEEQDAAYIAYMKSQEGETDVTD